MFQKINDKINCSYESDIPMGKEEIISLLRQKAVGQNPFSFFSPEQIDFKEIKFLDKRIEILRKPGIFSAFRPFGKIVMTFTEVSSTSTKLRCDVMPGNNTIPVMFIIQTIILLLWSVGWVVLGWRLDPLTRYLPPICVIAISSTILFLKYKNDRRSLIDYSKMVIKLMRQ